MCNCVLLWVFFVQTVFSRESIQRANENIQSELSKFYKVRMIVLFVNQRSKREDFVNMQLIKNMIASNINCPIVLYIAKTENVSFCKYEGTLQNAHEQEISYDWSILNDLNKPGEFWVTPYCQCIITVSLFQRFECLQGTHPHHLSTSLFARTRRMLSSREPITPCTDFK